MKEHNSPETSPNMIELIDTAVGMAVLCGETVGMAVLWGDVVCSGVCSGVLWGDVVCRGVWWCTAGEPDGESYVGNKNNTLIIY